MKIICRNCDYRFDRLPGSPASGPPDHETCPHCGATVDVAAQIAEMASRTTDEAGEHHAAVELEGADLSNRSLGDYEILDEVSRGAMGVIYKARHKKLGRIVALKVMLAGEHASPEQILRFEKEARAAARLRHPNIVPIYEIGIEGGKRFFTMDFIDGTPLDTLIGRKEMTLRRSLEIAEQVAAAFAYAHSRGVIHRDIKPSNIMIDRDGRAQITDFGLAKQVDSDTKFTRSGTTIGTPSYMSPEQARGENHKIDQQSDVYSLGAVLYEMLCGRPPFSGETMMNIVMKVIHDDPVPLRKINPKIHRDIQTIVFKAMEKEPARRYASMADLAEDLRRYLAGEMISARPAGAFRRVAKTLRKNRSTLIVALVIAVIGTAVSGSIIRILVERQDAARRQADQMKLALMLTQVDQKPEWVVQYRDDFSRPKLGPDWAASGPEWTESDGRLNVKAEKSSNLLLTHDLEGKIVIEFTATAQSADARINCFLGPALRSAYVFRFGNWEGSNVTLLRVGRVLAQVECPPLLPNVPYKFRIERTNTALAYRVTGGGETRELHYTDPILLATLGKFRFGLETWAAAVTFDDVMITREEFPGERLNKLQAIDSLYLSKGLLEKALAEYKAIVANHSGKAIAVLAAHNCGLIAEALATDPLKGIKEALEYYQAFEKSEGLLQNNYPAVVTSNRERLFFVEMEMGQYRQAAEDLAALCGRGLKTIDPGTAWQFPGILSRCASDLAFDSALEIMEKVRFAGPYRTLKDQWEMTGPRVRVNFTKAVNDVCAGFGEQKKFEEMKRAFAAVPDTKASKAFETAVAKAVESGDEPAALDLLLFVKGRGMRTPPLEQSALALAQRFITLKQYQRLTNVETAYPTRNLARLFAKAVAELAAADNPAGGVALFREACERFPEDRRTFADAASALMATCIKADKHADVRLVYGLTGEPRLAGRLIESADEQLKANQLDGAFETLEYIRANVPDRVKDLGPEVGDLAAKYVTADKLDSVLDLSTKYPLAKLPDGLAAAIESASKTGRRPQLERLMVRALARYPAEARVAEAMAAGARALVAANDADAALRAVQDAAKEGGEADKDGGGAILLAGAKALLGAKAYAQAAIACTAAAEAVAAKNADLAAVALTRAGLICQLSGDAEGAQRAWQNLIERCPKATRVPLAKLMTKALTAADFRKWLAQGDKTLEWGEDGLLAAVAASADGDKKQARDLLKRVVAGGKNSWPHDLAQAMLDQMPE